MRLCFSHGPQKQNEKNREGKFLSRDLCRSIPRIDGYKFRLTFGSQFLPRSRLIAIAVLQRDFPRGTPGLPRAPPRPAPLTHPLEVLSRLLRTPCSPLRPGKRTRVGFLEPPPEPLLFPLEPGDFLRVSRFDLRPGRTDNRGTARQDRSRAALAIRGTPPPSLSVSSRARPVHGSRKGHGAAKTKEETSIPCILNPCSPRSPGITLTGTCYVVSKVLPLRNTLRLMCALSMKHPRLRTGTI